MNRPFRECDYFTCARCGRRITRGGSRRATLACRDCQQADPYAVAAILGEMPPQAAATTGRPRKPSTVDRDTWTDDDLKKAARQYRKEGARDTWTVEGYREYHRRYAARRKQTRDQDEDAA